MTKPGVPIDSGHVRLLDIEQAAELKALPYYKRKRIQRKRKKMAQMVQAVSDIQVPPGSESHPNALDMSTWVPYWRVSLQAEDFENPGTWESPIFFDGANSTRLKQIDENGNIVSPPLFATDCKFDVINQGLGNEIKGSITFKAWDINVLKKYVKYLAIGSRATIEMGYNTSLNSKISGYNPKQEYQDKMKFYNDGLILISYNVNYDQSNGMWDLVLEYIGMSSFCIGAISVRDITVADDTSPRPNGDIPGDGSFKKFYSEQISITNKLEAQKKDYLKVIAPNPDKNTETKIMITVEGIVATLNKLMEVLFRDDLTPAQNELRRKIYDANITQFPIKFSYNDKIKNDVMLNSDFIKMIETDNDSNINDWIQRLLLKLSEYNHDMNESAKDKTARTYMALQSWKDIEKEGEEENLQIELTSIGAQKDDVNNHDFGNIPFYIGNQNTIVKSFSISQEVDSVITAEAVGGATDVNGLPIDTASSGGVVTEGATTGNRAEPLTELLMFPIKCDIELFGFSGFQYFQLVNMQGLGGENLYDGNYIISGISYVADGEGWITKLELYPDLSAGSFPNSDALLGRHQPPKAHVGISPAFDEEGIYEN